jgi:hypothetical protein
MSRWAMAALTGWASLSATTATATAATPTAPFELRWQAPQACPAEATVAARIAGLLEASASTSHRAPQVQATARVQEVGAGFELELSLTQEGVTGVRNLAAPTCDEIARATSLLVALAVEPALLAADNAKPGAATSCPPVAPAPGNVPRVVACPACPACPRAEPPPPAPPVRPAPGLSFLAGVALAYGALPQTLPRPLVGALYRPGAHWLEASLGGSFGVRRVAGARAAMFTQWFAAPRYCWGSSGTAFQFSGCGAIELGLIRGSGLGVDEPRSQTEWWLAAGPGIQLGMRLAAGGQLLLGVDVLWAATRPKFVLAGEPVHTPSAVFPALRLALIGSPI